VCVCVCVCVCVSNLVSYIKGKTRAEGIRELRAEDDIRA
jgi:hypothetical protein